MPIDIKLARELFAEVAAGLDEALAAKLGTENLDPLEEVDKEVSRHSQPGEILGSKTIDLIDNIEVSKSFERAFEDASEIARLLGITGVEARDFEIQGYDFERLAAALEEGGSLENLTPVVAPHGVGLRAWQELFKNLKPSVGLEVSQEIEREFGALDRAPKAQSQTTPLLAVEIMGNVWSVRLIPASQKPPVLGFNHEHGPHPTLPEMLTLQVQKLLRKEEPVDKTTFTWLHGLVSLERLAARHIFDEATGSILLSTREASNQGPHLGARHPKW